MPRTTLAPLAALAALALAGPASAATSTSSAHAPTPTETYPVLQQQIAAGQVKTARINRKAHRVTITLSGGKRFAILYPSRDEQKLAASLRAHGATVRLAHHRTHAKHKQSSSHHIRYYVLAVVIIAAIALGAFLLVRRRRTPRAKE